MNLCIDAGNTRVKAALFGDGKMLIDFVIFSEFDMEQLNTWLADRPVDRVILSSVRAAGLPWEAELAHKPNFHRFSIDSKMPIKINYNTPLTLGLDRLAGVIGARSLIINGAILTIDCGTCITMNCLDENSYYQGGSISPGLRMRLKALHQFTGRLPLLSLEKPEQLIGKTTGESILSGAIGGAAREIEASIAAYMQLYPNLTVIITGGDGDFLVSQIKKQIFAVPYLVLQGLNEILILNV